MATNLILDSIKNLTTKPLTLYGCGALCLEFVENYIETANHFNLIPNITKLVDKYGHNNYIDSIFELLKSNGVNQMPLIEKKLIRNSFEDLILITTASNALDRNNLFNQAKGAGYSFGNYFHQSTYISDLAKISCGVISFRNTFFGANSITEENVFINNDVSIAHASLVGSSSVICPRVNISGGAKIGKCCFIATGAVIDNNAVLGDMSKVSALSFYTKKRGKSNQTYFGNPAK